MLVQTSLYGQYLGCMDGPSIGGIVHTSECPYIGNKLESDGHRRGCLSGCPGADKWVGLKAPNLNETKSINKTHSANITHSVLSKTRFVPTSKKKNSYKRALI